MNIKLYSYLYGLFGTDGSIRRTHDEQHIQSIRLELIDKDVLEKIQTLLTNCSVSERIRDTNYKKNYHSYTLNCTNNELIQWLEYNNFPIKNKTKEIGLPQDYDENSFWRGVIDGDGSIGQKSDGQPFVNLTTDSENLKNGFCDYIEKLTSFRPNINRNKRDNIYNITIHGEKALKILANLYEDNFICIERKYQNYLKIKDWKKKNKKDIKYVRWTTEEEKDVMQLSIEEFMQKYPTRTLLAIKAKKKRLGGD